MISIAQLMKNQPIIWRSFMEILDQLLIAGIHDSADFHRGHREFLFAYISKKNNCKYCINGHTALAEKFGVTELDQNILDLADQLYNNIDQAADMEKTTLLQQILYTISSANFFNVQVIAHDVQMKGLTPTLGKYSPEFGYVNSISGIGSQK
jgi:AhpD family alkylhydroperoxidase